ncbi:hypothetical protein [Yersinia thracica]|uniref:hypothetical protein n=1 Tax=Yersinia thracica TaxID=2890319 RepID=UPI0011A64D4A|nr:hypothetical protein [Yersinia thracica]
MIPSATTINVTVHNTCPFTLEVRASGQLCRQLPQGDSFSLQMPQDHIFCLRINGLGKKLTNHWPVTLQQIRDTWRCKLTTDQAEPSSIADSLLQLSPEECDRLIGALDNVWQDSDIGTRFIFGAELWDITATDRNFIVQARPDVSHRLPLPQAVDIWQLTLLPGVPALGIEPQDAIWYPRQSRQQGKIVRLHAGQRVLSAFHHVKDTALKPGTNSNQQSPYSTEEAFSFWVMVPGGIATASGHPSWRLWNTFSRGWLVSNGQQLQIMPDIGLEVTGAHWDCIRSENGFIRLVKADGSGALTLHADSVGLSKGDGTLWREETFYPSFNLLYTGQQFNLIQVANGRFLIATDYGATTSPYATNKPLLPLQWQPISRDVGQLSVQHPILGTRWLAAGSRSLVNSAGRAVTLEKKPTSGSLWQFCSITKQQGFLLRNRHAGGHLADIDGQLSVVSGIPQEAFWSGITPEIISAGPL